MRSFRFISAVFAAALTLVLTPPTVSGANSVSDDDQLSNLICATFTGFVPTIISAEEVRTRPSQSSFAVRVIREERGRKFGVPNLKFTLKHLPSMTTVRGQTDEHGVAKLEGSCHPGTALRMEAVMRSDRYTINNGYQTYRIEAEVPCGGESDIIFKSNGPGAELLHIWDVATRAEKKLEASVGLDFWHQQVRFVWPSRNDSYRMGTIYVVDGNHWDIVGHELGHAVFEQARLGVLGTGPHSIDGCHTEELAFAEGWASFFSAWLNFDLADPDPKFEFMAPRLAPISVEHVPGFACQSETNEWRVTGFFWDLIDWNNDGENSTLSFRYVWDAMKGSRAGSASEVRKLLLQNKAEPATLARVWELNFGK